MYMSKKNVTFVTCYFTIYEEDISPSRSFEKRLELFLKIADTGINICIFISPEVKNKMFEIIEKYNNIKLIDVYSKEELRFSCKYFPEIELCKLPDNRNSKKDTEFYMSLMNSKIDFIKSVIDVDPFSTEYFSWFDFGLPYIFKDIDNTLTLFNKISQANYNGPFLIMPGCWSHGINDINYIKNNICWRFCGGFFIGDKNSLLNFYNLSVNNFNEFLQQTNKNLWEVNYWTWLETNKNFNPIWFSAVHNDSIINIPEELYKLISLHT